VISLFWAVSTSVTSPRDAPWTNKTKEAGIPTLHGATKTTEIPEHKKKIILFLATLEITQAHRGTKSIV
jgi:hypothetical protein